MTESGSRATDWWARRRTERLVGISMVISGSVHGLVTPAHFGEWWGYGVFFLAASICLIGCGLGLITDAIDPRYTPGDVHRLRRILYSAAIAGNIALIAMYVVSRTAGIPLGPGAGTVEIVQGPDLVAKVTEVVAIGGLALLLWKGRTRRPAGGVSRTGVAP